MKIALLSPSIYMSPTKYSDMIFAPRDLSVDLANGLTEKGHEVYFFTAPDVSTTAKLMEGDKDLLEKEYVKTMLHGRTSERLEWGYFYMLKQNYELDLTQRCYAFAKENGIEIIHAYHDRVAHFFESMTGIPTIYTLHDPLPTEETNLTYWLLSKFAGHKYVSISNAFRRSEKLHLNFVDTVYHGIALPTVSPDSKPQYLAFMARLIAEKGADAAIEVSKRAGIPIHLASSKDKANISDDTYYQTVLAPRIDPSLVSFVDFMGGAKKYEFFANAICLLFPIGWEEPFGMVMIEAMAAGAPVVAYNRGSVAEIVKDGITGFIIDPDNEDRPGKGSWTIKTQGVDGLVEAVKRIGEIDRVNCRKHVEENFSIAKMVEGYERVYTNNLSHS